MSEGCATVLKLQRSMEAARWGLNQGEFHLGQTRFLLFSVLLCYVVVDNKLIYYVFVFLIMFVVCIILLVSGKVSF